MATRQHWALWWNICVVKEPEDDTGQGVDSLLVVGGGNDLRQGVLESLTQHGVKGQVWTYYLLLHPFVALQIPDLCPQAVQVLQTHAAPNIALLIHVIHMQYC